tara:strand:+ start:3223 stop:3675 length:453 start_codon:yes stop_codon:yes gene_type:complete
MEGQEKVEHDNDKKILDFIKLIGVPVENKEQLDGLMIEREFLVNSKNYENVREKIPEIKKIYSSTFLTSLHSNADKTQKWPLLNLLRQILRKMNYTMEPIRTSNGKDSKGKKLYKRYFRIQKKVKLNEIKQIMEIKNLNLTNEDSSKDDV